MIELQNGDYAKITMDNLTPLTKLFDELGYTKFLDAVTNLDEDLIIVVDMGALILTTLSEKMKETLEREFIMLPETNEFVFVEDENIDDAVTYTTNGFVEETKVLDVEGRLFPIISSSDEGTFGLQHHVVETPHGSYAIAVPLIHHGNQTIRWQVMAFDNDSHKRMQQVMDDVKNLIN